jgi:hypothetical protein
MKTRPQDEPRLRRLGQASSPVPTSPHIGSLPVGQSPLGLQPTHYWPSCSVRVPLRTLTGPGHLCKLA